MKQPLVAGIEIGSTNTIPGMVALMDFCFERPFGSYSMTLIIKSLKRISLIWFIVITTNTFLVGQDKLDCTSYVNPFIGTGGHGHTFPGAVVPFGMVQLSPDTRIDGSWDGCSGYHYSDSIIYGFSHTHLSGTGISDYGDIMLMPLVDKKAFTPVEYSSTFSHSNELAQPGYYSVKLDNDVLVELTSTNRVGMHRYKFPKNTKSSLAFDFSHRDECTEAYLKIESPTRVVGYRRSKAWALDQYVAFVMEFSKPMISHVVSINHVESDIMEINQTNAKLNFNFQNDGSALLVKVAISMVGVDGAEKNMKEEVPHWNFDEVRSLALKTWNHELNRIQVTANNDNDKTIFYTALYHCFTHPSTASDVDGRYRGMDKEIHQSSGYTHYTIFSLWDTFRALHPLFTIVQQQRSNDFIQSFLSMYQQGGRLPVWELAANETDCMIGYHSASVIADAAVKGINKFDMSLAFEGMKKSSLWPHLGLPAYTENAVITIDDEHESVSKTLEYAYDDFCIAQMAKLLKNESDFKTYSVRSLSYRNLFDKQTGFIRPKKNGGWLSPFDPREVNNHFTEANAWQYTFFAPHDITGHISLMGGSENFEKKLDELFNTSSKTTGREQADITGLIGQYAHGNEPSHHMAYLYNYVGKSSKTQARVREILTSLYHNKPDGLSGNEDCGQMSAWYVLSSMGLYQVTPGTVDFAIGSPLYDKVTISLENGKSFSVVANNNAMDAPFISNASLNGVHFKSPMISYQKIMDGGELLFHLSNTESNYFTQVPLQLVDDNSFVGLPVISGSNKSFKGMSSITLASCDDCIIYYTLDQSPLTEKSLRYKHPIELNQTVSVRAMAIDKEGNRSASARADFYKFPHDWSIKLKSPYNPQYSAGGDDGIIDGIRGTENWRKGEWQGYQTNDFELVIDLKRVKKISEVGGGFLQDTRAWIIMPTHFEVEISKDGQNFKKVGATKNTFPANDYSVKMQDLKITCQEQARFVKIRAYNFGKLPDWHQGYPFHGEAFIFIDEVWVK